MMLALRCVALIPEGVSSYRVLGNNSKNRVKGSHSSQSNELIREGRCQNEVRSIFMKRIWKHFHARGKY